MRRPRATPSFVNLHSAAGVGHAMGNIFTAHKNRTPMVITAGQQARSILPFDPFLFSAQATELPKPYVKWSCEPARAEDVPLAIARAYYIAMQQPRGPVLVSVPADDWDKLSRAGAAARGEHRIAARAARAGADRRRARRQRAPGLCRSAPRWTATTPGTKCVQLAERHNARVWVAPMSGRCGFPEDHRLFAGFLPAMREKIVSLLGGHDLIFVVGAPAFTYHVEGAGPHVPAGATLYQLIDDPTIAAWTPVGTSAVGSIRLGVLDLLARPAPAPRALPAPRATPPAGRALGTACRRPMCCRRWPKCATPASIVVEEAPSARAPMHDYLPILRSETFYTMCSGGLGHSLPAAVGVALAKPGAQVIGLIGDGSAMYSIQALWSAAQLRLPITFVILKNRRYAALQEFAPAFGFKPEDQLEGTALPDLDFVALARGQGCDAVHVSDAGPAARRAAPGAALHRPDAGRGRRGLNATPRKARNPCGHRVCQGFPACRMRRRVKNPDTVFTHEISLDQTTFPPI